MKTLLSSLINLIEDFLFLKNYLPLILGAFVAGPLATIITADSLIGFLSAILIFGLLIINSIHNKKYWYGVIWTMMFIPLIILIFTKPSIALLFCLAIQFLALMVVFITPEVLWPGTWGFVTGWIIIGSALNISAIIDGTIKGTPIAVLILGLVFLGSGVLSHYWEIRRFSIRNGQKLTAIGIFLIVVSMMGPMLTELTKKIITLINIYF